MTAEDLQSTLQDPAPPHGLHSLVDAMWWQAQGDWHRAHLIAQDTATRNGAWVHAYLHRAEGDLGNAGYWYRQAARPLCRTSLQEEWIEVVQALLASAGNE